MVNVIPTHADRTIEEAAARLAEARASKRPTQPLRDVLGESDIAAAYAVQRALTERRLADGGSIVGHKIGLTSPAVQEQLGVDQPDFGVLFADMDMSDRAVIRFADLLHPRIEAEIAFTLVETLDAGDLSLDQVRAAVGHAFAALEIVDSRIADWDIRITDTVADNASSGQFVLSGRGVGLAEFEPRDVTMRMYRGQDLVSDGTGRACLGDPLLALQWLARTARDHGEPLRSGQVVLSGALGPMVAVQPGATYRADISSLGAVSATFSETDPS